MLLPSESEGSYRLFSPMYFSVGVAFLSFLFLLTINHTVQKALLYEWKNVIYLSMMSSYVSMNDLANFEERTCGLNNQQEEFTKVWLGLLNFFSDLSVPITATCSFVFP